MKIDESWYVKPKDKDFPFRVSCGGVVVRKKGRKLLVALIRDKRFSEHNYMLPKGRQEMRENLIDTAKREIAEETGLSELNFLTELGYKERLTFEKNEWRKIYFFLFSTKQESGIQKLEEGEKDYEVEWINLDKLPSFFWPEQREIIEENIKKIKRHFENT